MVFSCLPAITSFDMYTSRCKDDCSCCQKSCNCQEGICSSQIQPMGLFQEFQITEKIDTKEIFNFFSAFLYRKEPVFDIFHPPKYS